MKRCFIAYLFLISSAISVAQKDIANQQNSWYVYQFTVRVHSKFGVQADYQFRRHGWGETWQQSVLRSGIDYSLNRNISITVGHVWVKTYPYGKQPSKFIFDEQRIWEQVLVKQQVGRFYFNHRYKLEQRFIENIISDSQGNPETDGYLFRERFRYRFMFSVPLNKKTIENKSISLVVSNEFFVNFGKGVAKNVYDQNRFSAGLSYQFSEMMKLQAGYLNQYILKPDGIRAENNHTLQITITSAFDFRKKEEEKN